MSDSQIQCVTLKINEDELLMPKASLAEIIAIKNIINVANKPIWMLGYLDWHGNSVPLVSFEAMGGVRMPSLASGNVKAAVLYSISEDEDFPYVAILMQDSPGMININESDVVIDNEEIKHPAIESRVMLSEKSYSLINLENLENLIKKIMVHR